MTKRPALVIVAAFMIICVTSGLALLATDLFTRFQFESSRSNWSDYPAGLEVVSPAGTYVAGEVVDFVLSVEVAAASAGSSGIDQPERWLDFALTDSYLMLVDPATGFAGRAYFSNATTRRLIHACPAATDSDCQNGLAIDFVFSYAVAGGDQAADTTFEALIFGEGGYLRDPEGRAIDVRHDSHGSNRLKLFPRGLAHINLDGDALLRMSVTEQGGKLRLEVNRNNESSETVQPSYRVEYINWSKGVCGKVAAADFREFGRDYPEPQGGIEINDDTKPHFCFRAGYGVSDWQYKGYKRQADYLE